MSVSVPKDKDLRFLIKEPTPYQRGRTIQWFEKTDAGLRSREMKHGVARSRRAPVRLPLLVTGTGRCGTTWLSETLQAAGFDVPHEYCGRDGVVSLFFQTDADWHPFIPWSPGEKRVAHVGERRSDFDFRHVAHLVRHPLQVVASMASITSQLIRSWYYESGVTKAHWRHRPALERDLTLWCDSVENCERIAQQTIRLRDAGRPSVWWPDMLERAGLEYVPMPVLPAKNRSTGFKKHAPPTWADVGSLRNPQLYTRLRRLVDALELES